MPDTVTANLLLIKPEIAGSADTWGNKVNANMDKVDAYAKATRDIADAAVPKAGATMTGQLKLAADPADGDSFARKSWIETRIAQLVAAAVPPGIITMWHGNAGNVPAGWAFCNGQVVNGYTTPNLVDRHVVCGGLTFGFWAIGGAWQHQHGAATQGHTLTNLQMPTHVHTLLDPGHSHGVSDPGHTHPYTIPAYAGGFGIGAAAGSPGPVGSNTGGSNTGIAIQGALTGLDMASAGGGQPHSHVINLDSNLSPYFALAFIMKVS